MKKLIRNMVLASLLLLAGMPTKAQTHPTFSTAAAVAAVDDKQSNDGAFILVNVGTGERLSFGGNWGMQPMTHSVGMLLYLETGTETASGGTYYKIGSNTYANQTSYPGYIGYIPGDKYDDDEDSHGHLFVDRYGSLNDFDGVVRMIFTNVNNDDTDPLYTISLLNYGNISHVTTAGWYNSSTGDYYGTTQPTGDDADNYTYLNEGDWLPSDIASVNSTTLYLTATGPDNALVEAYAENTEIGNDMGVVSATNTNCQWRIVTKTNLINYFASTNQSNQTETASATFLVVDQNFNRKNTQQDDAWTFSGAGTMAIGCGYDANVNAQKTYGAYWLNRIDGAGIACQKITAPLAGWYQLRVKGFSTGSPTANAIIWYGDSDPSSATDYSTSSLNQFTRFTTELDSIQTLEKNDNAGTYDYDAAYAELIKKYDTELIAATSEYSTETNVMLYIPTANTDFYIGVEAFAGSVYTLIDDIQLYYSGNSLPLVLDENWTDEDLINMQVDAGNTRTLFLKRTLKEEKWNSLLLPVSLTVNQVKEAFGGNTKLCKLKETKNSGHDIYFESVAYATDDYLATHTSTQGILAGTDKLIKADSMYIIWPSDLDQYYGDYNYTLTNSSNDITDLSGIDASANDITIKDGVVTGTLADSCFQIPLVSLDASVKTTLKTDTVVRNVGGTNTVDGGIYMQGTYVAGASIPQYSYAIKADDGLWYYLKVSGVTSKGFRTWIRTVDSDGNGAHPAVANLFIDNVQVSDGIERVVQDLLRQEPVGSVYSLSGQMVNADGSLEGLPKGIYVKGGKKYVVK